jgi:hypothetical protein
MTINPMGFSAAQIAFAQPAPPVLSDASTQSSSTVNVQQDFQSAVQLAGINPATIIFGGSQSLLGVASNTLQSSQVNSSINSSSLLAPALSQPLPQTPIQPISTAGQALQAGLNVTSSFPTSLFNPFAASQLRPLQVVLQPAVAPASPAPPSPHKPIRFTQANDISATKTLIKYSNLMSPSANGTDKTGFTISSLKAISAAPAGQYPQELVDSARYILADTSFFRWLGNSVDGKNDGVLTTKELQYSLDDLYNGY